MAKYTIEAPDAAPSPKPAAGPKYTVEPPSPAAAKDPAIFQPIHDVVEPLKAGVENLKEDYKAATAPDEKPSAAGMVPLGTKKDRATLKTLGDVAGLGLQGVMDLTGVGEALNIGSGTLSRALSLIPGAQSSSMDKNGKFHFKPMDRGQREDAWSGAISKALMAVPGEDPAAPAARKGAKLAKAAAKTAGDEHASDVRMLHGEGVRMTPGQVKGGAHMDQEAKHTSDPEAGHAIREGHIRSIHDFNRALYNRTLKQIGQSFSAAGKVGMDGVQAVHKALSDEYERLKPKMFAVNDSRLQTDIANARSMAGPHGSPEQARFDQLIDTRVNPSFFAGSAMGGEAFKKLESYISEQSRALRGGDAYQRNLADSYDEVLASLRSSLERHSAPTIRTQLKNLNAAWASAISLEDAAYAAKAADGVFTPNQYTSALGKGGRRYRSLVARGQARDQDFVRAAQRVLPSKVPDSGTAGRTAAIKGRFRNLGTLGGAGLGGALGLGHGLPFAAGGTGIGGTLGGVLGGIADRKLAPVTNKLEAARLDRAASKAREKIGIAPTHTSLNRRVLIPAGGALGAALRRNDQDEDQ